MLARVDSPDARAFYEIQVVKESGSARELERQIASLLFERLAKSRDKAGVMRLATKGHEIASPADIFKDPVVIEFLGLPELAVLRRRRSRMEPLKTNHQNCAPGHDETIRAARIRFITLVPDDRSTLALVSPPAAIGVSRSSRPLAQPHVGFDLLHAPIRNAPPSH